MELNFETLLRVQDTMIRIDMSFSDISYTVQLYKGALHNYEEALKINDEIFHEALHIQITTLKKLIAVMEKAMDDANK